jgi:HEAT repeat protein
MAVTMADLRAQLDPEEVDYERARQLGSDAIPSLMQLVQGGNLGLAAKAAYLASLIESEHAADVLETAAASPEPVVWVAAASGLRNVRDTTAARILERVRTDPDAGARKVAVQSVARFTHPQLRAKVQQIVDEDPDPFVRESAANTIRRMR